MTETRDRALAHRRQPSVMTSYDGHDHQCFGVHDHKPIHSQHIFPIERACSGQQPMTVVSDRGYETVETKSQLTAKRTNQLEIASSSASDLATCRVVSDVTD